MVFRSSHPPLFDWDDWALRCRGFPGTPPDTGYEERASKLAMAFWGRIGDLMRSRICSELSNEEKALWIQSGLAVSPLMGTCLQYSLDFCLAWKLIGEWTSRVLFPVPKGQWPRHGHAGALLQSYQTPRIVASARAEKVAETDLLALGTKHLCMDAPLESVVALRDRLIELVSVGNLKHRPEALFALFRQFLRRLTLPRLCHFLDLVLPQLTPVRAP